MIRTFTDKAGEWMVAYTRLPKVRIGSLLILLCHAFNGSRRRLVTGQERLRPAFWHIDTFYWFNAHHSTSHSRYDSIKHGLAQKLHVNWRSIQIAVKVWRNILCSPLFVLKSQCRHSSIAFINHFNQTPINFLLSVKKCVKLHWKLESFYVIYSRRQILIVFLPRRAHSIGCDCTKSQNWQFLTN